MTTPRFLALLLVSVIALPTYSQGEQSSKAMTKPLDQPQSAPVAPQSPRPVLAFGLEDGTPVKMRITRTVSSADAKVNDTVDFEVLEDIKIKDTIVIRRGGIAWGTVTEAQPKRRMARGGKLNINIDSVRLVTGEKAALRAVKDMKGGGHTGAMTGAIVATSIVFFPAAPFFLFMHGKDITIPKGTEITAYISGDVALEQAKFDTTAVANGPATPARNTDPAPTASDLSTVTIGSTPDGADITVDGKFVGNTPSTPKLVPGDHTILVEKVGFKPWQRTMTVSPNGEVKVEATLEKATAGPKTVEATLEKATAAPEHSCERMAETLRRMPGGRLAERIRAANPGSFQGIDDVRLENIFRTDFPCLEQYK